MSTLQTRTNLILPDDGGVGGDDTVDVTSQLTNSIDYLSNGLGIYQCTSSTRPTTQNYVGRLIQETDTNTKSIFRYTGSGWEFIQDQDWETAWKPTWTTENNETVTPGTSSNRYGRYIRRGTSCQVNGWIYTGTTGFSGGRGAMLFSYPFVALGRGSAAD